MDDTIFNKHSNILVKGDISGIQDFIFNVRSKKAANGIKGRSFFIKVLTEIIIQYLFDAFKVDESERPVRRISTSGGNFFIILPELKDATTIMEVTQILISKSLRYSGLNVALHHVPFIHDKYSEILFKLNSGLRKSKLRLYGHLDNAGFSDIFEPQNKGDFNKIDENETWIQITNAIRSNQYFSIQPEGSALLILKNNSIELMGYICKFHRDENIVHKFILSDFLENVFPEKYGEIVDFEGLANDGVGVQKLGILKMDVDNLGTTLEKIKDVEEHREFDHELTQFFNKQLRCLIDSRFENKIYTVTAGGDDSFFVGHWKTILDLARRIHFEFMKHEYFKKKELSISAGYIIVNPKFPVVRFSQLADDALHKAKNKYQKGNICLFDEVLSWKLLDEVYTFMKDLRKGVEKKSKALLANSRQSAIRGILEDIITLKDTWEITYFLRDCTDKNNVETIRDKVTWYLKKSARCTTIMYKRAYRLVLPISARLIELEKR